MVEILKFATQNGIWTFLGVWLLLYTATGGILRFLTAIAKTVTVRK